MNGLLLALRCVLAAVFLAAGVGKLADLPGSRRAVVGFGLPEIFARPVGLMLPLAELVVAVALLPNPLAIWGALGALLLLLAFISGISISLARGQRPDCHCFGQIYSQPLGPSTLVRNGMLAAMATTILVTGRSDVGLDPLAWTTGLTNAERAGLTVGVLAFAVLLAQCWLLFQIWKQNNAMLRRPTTARSDALLPLPGALPTSTLEDALPQGLPVGSSAPSFVLPDLDGHTSTLDDLLAGGVPVMLLFTNPGCGPCAALMPEVAGWQSTYSGQIAIAVLGEGAVAENRPKAEEAGLATMFLQTGREIAEAYGVHGTPAAVVVYPEAVIASPIALGSDSIRELLKQVLSLVSVAPPIPLQVQAPARLPTQITEAPASHALIGAPLPRVSVTQFTGETVNLADLVEGNTLLLFWRSTCGFCEQLAPTLQAWESSPPPGSPNLVIILTATPDSKQVVNFRSTTVIDRDGEAALALQATGTPMAVLVDAQGRIASPVAAGAAEVMELANRSDTRVTA